MHFHSWLGITGVDEHENNRARRMARYFELSAVMMALWILVVWYQEARNTISPAEVQFHNWVIWLFFTIEAVVLTSVVRNKIAYLRGNWLNVVIVLAGIPLLLNIQVYAVNIGSLRLLLVFNLLLGMSGTLRKILSRNQLGATLMVTLVFTMVAGLIMHGVDPNIKTPSDGVWWAWATLTSVGYGDVVPVSGAGRGIAVVVMIVGMAFSALLTASILALFMSEQEGKIVRYSEKELEEQLKLEKRLEKLEHKIDHLIATLEKGT